MPQPTTAETSRRKFLFVSYDGLIGDIAWRVLLEGNEVRYSVKNPIDQEVGAGFVPMVDDWRAEVDWADVIVFDDVLGMGTEAARLREQGKLVVGGTPYTDRLEDDRSFGQEELRKHGIPIVPYRRINCSTIDCPLLENPNTQISSLRFDVICAAYFL